MLTKTDFEQYRARRAEIDLLKQPRALVRDTVRGSDPDYPYCEHPVTISGVSPYAAERSVRRADRLQKLCKAVETAIEAMPRSNERIALMMRYFDGCTWQEIGGALLISEDAARKLATRALDKIL